MVESTMLKQASKLVELPDEVLLEAIGFQLLALDNPSRAVSVASHIGSAAAISLITADTSLESPEALLPTALKAMGDVLGTCRSRAMAYLEEVTPAIARTLCEDRRLRRVVTERIDKGELAVQIVAELVAGALGYPPVLASLTFTISAWFVKRGLERICD